MANRIILHVDMDYFFAQVEERENSSIKGKPIVVGADPKGGVGRGVVSTANYEAREFGVRSAMPIARAYRLCPDAIFLPVNFELYEKVSENIMSILRKFSTKLEQISLDEAFLDISDKIRNYDEAREFAEKIKNRIYQKEKLTCSIGVGPNKLVSKLASDFRKPFGLTIVRPEDIEKFISPLKVRSLWGVGPKTEQRLNEMKIKTIEDLAKTDPEKLVKEFGVWGIKLYEYAHGIDDEEVVEFYEAKSIGREITFPEDVDDEKIIFQTIENLSQEMHKDLIKNNFSFKTVSIKIRYENFETHTRAKTLKLPANESRVISEVAKNLVKEFFQPNRKIRLIGVRVSGLIKKQKQQTLLENPIQLS